MKVIMFTYCYNYFKGVLLVDSFNVTVIFEALLWRCVVCTALTEEVRP